MHRVAASAQRVSLAARAGTAALLGTSLLLLFILAPYLAAEAHVGHTHPEGTPEHVHALRTVLTSLPAVDDRPCEDVRHVEAVEPAACVAPPTLDPGAGWPDPRAPPPAFV